MVPTNRPHILTVSVIITKWLAALRNSIMLRAINQRQADHRQAALFFLQPVQPCSTNLITHEITCPVHLAANAVNNMQGQNIVWDCNLEMSGNCSFQPAFACLFWNNACSAVMKWHFFSPAVLPHWTFPLLHHGFTKPNLKGNLS